MNDVLIFQSLDDGNIEIENGQITLSRTLESAVYLCLFGGNAEDSGGQNNELTWWGNVDEQLPERKMVSRFQHLVDSIAIIPANLRRLEQAAKQDLEPLAQYYESVEIVATIPQRNRVRLRLTFNDTELEFIADQEANGG